MTLALFLAAWAIGCAAAVWGVYRFANWQRRDVARVTRWGRETPVHAETVTPSRSSATHNAAIERPE